MDEHWLARPRTIRWLWIAFLALLAASVLAQSFLPVEGHFGIDATLGFNAWYGFATCAAMIVVARLLGWVLKRSDRYYQDDGEGTR